ncbi:hypothetical protein [Nonomuraea endophytica]|uniref:DUF4367 domain-containing protein n=1 Tax=Nonomuraea endophytica TaxID=714136 RepID=A0A7W8EH20_9ACTN|nr:hypothetical protein [Nonomuraea endophytica]MBB5079149.1 hypothetical protein [Nonomuraea endophytica]
MRHPTDGTLRRLLDEPAAIADADREHVAGCPYCRSGLAVVQQDAALVGAALDGTPDVDVDAGWRRLSGALVAEGSQVTVPAGPGRRRWKALRSPVAAVVGAAVLVSGVTAAAAAEWLPIFRAEQITPVVAPRADLVQMPDLSDLGDMEVTERIDLRQVADAAAAKKATGLSVPQVNTLPRGVTGRPTFHVVGRVSATLTFSAEKTAGTVASAGKTLPPTLPGLDGSRFRLAAGPAVAAAWSAGRPMPALIVARAVPPTAESSGVPFRTARDYLLSLGVLPENVASQLRAFSGDGTTLPLFTTIEKVTSSATDVGGVPATLLVPRDGTMAAVIWMDRGVLTVVAGSLSADEVLSVARELKVER